MIDLAFLLQAVGAGLVLGGALALGGPPALFIAAGVVIVAIGVLLDLRGAR